MKKSANAARGEAGETLWQEFQSTRVIWNDGLEAVKPSARVLAAQLSQFAKHLYDSPVGKRAQQHPATAICIALATIFVCGRLLRR